MRPWFKADSGGWSITRAAICKPFPKASALLDAEWWDNIISNHGNDTTGMPIEKLPTKTRIAKDWGWGTRRTLAFLKQNGFDIVRGSGRTLGERSVNENRPETDREVNENRPGSEREVNALDPLQTPAIDDNERKPTANRPQTDRSVNENRPQSERKVNAECILGNEKTASNADYSAPKNKKKEQELRTKKKNKKELLLLDSSPSLFDSNALVQSQAVTADQKLLLKSLPDLVRLSRAHRLKSKQRWKYNPADALKWWTSEIIPKDEYYEGYRMESLESWIAYQRDNAEGSKFAANWKSSLRRWILKPSDWKLKQIESRARLLQSQSKYMPDRYGWDEPKKKEEPKPTTKPRMSEEDFQRKLAIHMAATQGDRR